MKKLSATELLGIFLYIAAILMQYMKINIPIISHADTILYSLVTAFFSIIIIAYLEGLFSKVGMGLLLSTGALLWELHALQTDANMAKNTLLLSGLLMLVGVMLLSKARQLSSGMASIMGWLAVIILYFSTKTLFGSTLLLCLSLLPLGLYLKGDGSGLQAPRTKKK